MPWRILQTTISCQGGGPSSISASTSLLDGAIIAKPDGSSLTLTGLPKDAHPWDTAEFILSLSEEFKSAYSNQLPPLYR